MIYMINNRRSDTSKQIMLSIIGMAILLVSVAGVSFAFFNYTRTGVANTIKVGRISFNTTQDGTINVTNLFPIDSDDIGDINDSNNNVTINIVGSTDYDKGIEYLVTAEDVNVTVNEKKIPLNILVSSTENVGNNDPDYFDNRGGETSIHKVLSGGVVVPGQYLVVGYIAKGQTGVNGNLNIKAYIDKDKIAISDTYDGTESDNMGTTSNWVNGRTVFTTSEWNSLSTSSNSLSFKIKVEANEGTWVEPYTTPNLMNGININRNGANIKEIRFIQETPLRMQRRYDASVGQESNGTKADLTYQNTGKVLAWIEPITVNPTGTSNTLNVKPSKLINDNSLNNVEQIDNETSYVLYIASSGDTKWVYTGNSNIFSGFSNVEKIVFENFDTSAVAAMVDMFKDLSKLTSVNVNALDTSSVQVMNGMFSGCSSLTRIDLSGLGSDNLVGIGNMFYNCNALTEIIMKNFNFGHVNFNQTINNYSNYYYAFANLPNVETIDLTNANTSGVTNMFDMFYNCKKLTNIIGLSTLDTSNVTNMSYMFSDCSSLTIIDLSGLGGDTLNNVYNMFSGCTNLASINMSNFNFGTITSFTFDSTTNTLFSGMSGLSNLITVNLHGAKTNYITNMDFLFTDCQKLTSVDLSGMGSNNLSLINGLFYNCNSLQEINMEEFNFGVVDFSYGTNYYYAFANLPNVETIDLTNANISGVKNMYKMFADCKKLKTVILDGIDTSGVTNINNMFSGCNSLTSLDLSSFDTRNITGLDSMFYGDSNLKTIYVSNTWNTANINANSVFYNCTALVGGNGTIFDSNKTDATMAVVDTPSTPGYLTLKTS